MALAYQTIGSAASGGTGMTVTYPTVQANDLLVLLVVNKYPSNGPTTPTGWTLQAQQSGGQGSDGSDSGNVYSTVYTKIADGTETGTFSVTVTSANVCYTPGILVYRPSASTKGADVAVASGADNTAGTSWSVTTGSLNVRGSDDLILALSASNGTNGNGSSAHALSETGVTFGAATSRVDSGGTSGFDGVRSYISEHAVSSGSGNAAVTFTMTLGSSGTNYPAGATVLLRIGEATMARPSVVAATAMIGAPTVGSVGTVHATATIPRPALIPTSGLKAWFRASDKAVANGTTVTTIPQRQGIGNWASGGGTVTYRTTDGPNSRPAYQAAAATAWQGPANFMSGVTSGEFIAVVKANGTATSNPGFFGDGSPDANYYPYTDGMVYEKFGCASVRQSFTPTLSVDSWRVYSIRSGGGTIKIYLDGVLQHSASVTNGFEADPSLFNFSGSGWTGHIAELLIYDHVLSGAERNQVMLDLNSEYGFTVPYEIAPATVPATATVGVPAFTVPRMTYQTTGSAASGGSGMSVTYPSLQANDLLVMLIANKYPSNAPTTPTGWTLQAQQSGGQGSAGSDSGNVYASVYTRIADGTESGTVSVTVSSGNVCYTPGIMVYRPSGSTKGADVVAASGADNTAGTSWSVTTGGLSVRGREDLIIALTASNGSNSNGSSSHALTESGVVFFGGVTSRVDSGGTGGFDGIRTYVSEHQVSSGSGSGAATFTMTLGSSGTDYPAGATVLLRIGEVTVSRTVANIARTTVPLDYSPTMWLDAETLSGADGDQIGAWVDRSGNNNHAASAGATRPQYRTTAGPLGGKTVEFNDVGYFTLPNLMSGATAGEIFIVVKADYTGSAQSLWTFGADTGSNDGQWYPYSDGVVYESFGRSQNNRPSFTPSPNTHSAFRIYNVWSAFNDWAALIDGVSQATDTSNTVTWNSSPLLGLSRDVPNTSVPFDGLVAEVILFRRKLSTAERAEINRYLVGKHFRAAPATVAVTAAVDSAGLVYGGSTTTNPATVRATATIPRPALLPTSGIKAWFRASDKAVANGTTVTTFPQRQGLGDWASGGGTVTYRTTDGPNSRPAYQAASAYQWAGPTNFMSGVTAAEFFAVVKATDLTNNRGFFGNGSPDANYYPDSATTVYEGFGSNSRRSFTPTVGVDSWRVYSVRSGGGTIKIYLDGVLQHTASVTNTFEAAPYLFDFASSIGWTGLIAELLIFDHVLTGTERNQVLLDLNTEYAFTVPYEIAPGTVPVTATVGAAVPIISAAITPAVVPVTATVGAPTVTLGTTAAVVTATVTATVGDAGVNSNRPDTVNAAVTVGDPSVPALEAAATVAAVASVGSPTFTSSATITPATVAGVATVGSAIVVVRATPLTVAAVTSVGAAEVNPVRVPAVTVAATATVGVAVPVGNLRIVVTKVSATATVGEAVVEELQISSTAGLGGLGGTATFTDSRTGWATTITSPLTAALVTDGGITVYGTVVAADNVEAEMHVQISTSSVFATILDEGYSAGVDPGEVASVSLSGLVAGTTYYVRARGGHSA